MHLFIIFCIIFSQVYAQIPCDDAYGEFCPEAQGWAVETCLKEHMEKLSSDCINFINMSDTCKSDISKHCKDKQYTGDLLSCLTEWTKPEDLTDACKEALPKKASKKERGQTKEERAKANKRRRTRQQAAQHAREQL